MFVYLLLRFYDKMPEWRYVVEVVLGCPDGVDQVHTVELRANPRTLVGDHDCDREMWPVVAHGPVTSHSAWRPRFCAHLVFDYALHFDASDGTRHRLPFSLCFYTRVCAGHGISRQAVDSKTGDPSLGAIVAPPGIVRAIRSVIRYS